MRRGSGVTETFVLCGSIKASGPVHEHGFASVPGEGSLRLFLEGGR